VFTQKSLKWKETVAVAAKSEAQLTVTALSHPGSKAGNPNSHTSAMQ
jgi:hypothetical protein